MAAGCRIDEGAMRARRVIQITDCHLPRDEREWKRGGNADFNLAAVIAEARRWRPDVVVASGDLADDGDPPAYERLRGHLLPLGIPVYALPGNHDDPAALRRWLCGGAIRWAGEAALDGWRLVLLDSTIPGEPGGRIDAADLATLAAPAAGEPSVVFVHHPPVPVESPWIDEMGLANGDELLAALAQRGGTRVVACGHVHHVFAAECDGIAVLTAPATSFQAEPRRATFELDSLGPGFRWFDLYPDGSWRSGTRRVASPGPGG